MNCVTPENNKLKINLYVNKKSANISDVRGNLTFKVPLDDTFNVSYITNGNY